MNETYIFMLENRTCELCNLNITNMLVTQFKKEGRKWSNIWICEPCWIRWK